MSIAHARVRRDRARHVASYPGSPPPFFLVRMCKGREGESLGTRLHVTRMLGTQPKCRAKVHDGEGS